MSPLCFLSASSSVRMELGYWDRDFVELLEVVVEELGDATLLLGFRFQRLQMLRTRSPTLTTGLICWAVTP